MALRREGSAARRARAALVLQQLAELYPLAVTALEHHGSFQLLVATVLSAQTTDRMVNRITPALFARFPGPAELADAPEGELEALIRPVNYHKTKARHLRALSARLLERFAGQVPATLAELNTLPGVGRKTASVVLGGAFSLAEGVVVDTHVLRLARRLGFATGADAAKVEQELMALLPRESWIAASHRLIFHGREVCVARRPRCGQCVVAPLCPSAEVRPVLNE